MNSLQDFLEAKPLFYDEINLERMPKVYATIKDKLTVAKVIHVVGTNGKGTTGRFLANALLQNNLNVGHYTSPHILTFNERIWLNGENVDDSTLQKAHQRLLVLLTKEQSDALSYFEYTTLLAMLVYEKCDYVVLEAGLGGEFDATNVFKKALSLFTPIAIDHQAFLGDDIKSIAQTKFRSMETHAILGRQPNREVRRYFDEVANDKGCVTASIDTVLTTKEQQDISMIAQDAGLAKYLQENLLLSLSALKFLGFTANVEELAKTPLFGRLTQLRDNIVLDVGHNLLAAQAIAKTLSGKKYTLIYNSYRDKDYANIIKTLKPIIEAVELISVEDVRAEQESTLESVIEAEKIAVSKFATIEQDKSYLVFGSFSVAEAFLKQLNPIHSEGSSN